MQATVMEAAVGLGFIAPTALSKYCVVTLRHRRRHARTICSAPSPTPASPIRRDACLQEEKREDARDLRRLALPSFLAMLTEPLASLADLYFIGKLGSLPVAGVAIASAVFNPFCYTFTGLAYSTNAHVAAQRSAVDAERAALAASKIAVYLGIIVAIVLFVLAPPLVSAMKAAMGTSTYAVTYLRTRAVGMPFMFLTFALGGVFRARRDLRNPLVAATLAAALNAALDAALVPVTGVAGAGLATSLSAAVGCVYLIAALRRDDVIRALPYTFRVRIPDFSAIVAPLVALSSKRVLESFAFAVSCATASSVGAPSAAAMEIAQQVWWTVGVMWWPIGVAASAVIANLFASTDDRVRIRALRVGRLALSIVTKLALFGGAIVYFGAQSAAAWFVHEPAFIDASTYAVQLLAVLLPASALVDVCECILVAVGDATFVFFATAAGVALCLLLLHTLSSSITSVFTAMGVMIALQALLVLTRFAILWRRESAARVLHQS